MTSSSKKDPKWRNLAAFWLFGLCNNYAYVIMLSAAGDILSQHRNKTQEEMDSQCLKSITKRYCSRVGTSAVLLADILPTLLVSLTFPFFMQRIPFGIRHFFVCLMQAISYLLVSFSKNIPLSLIGVAFASIGSGLGEITYLSLTPFFDKNTISTWSSGTGGAGVIGALSYAALTEPKFAHLSPRITLLVMLVVPVVFALSYWFLLVIPPSVYQASLFDPSTWIVPVEKTGSDAEKERYLDSRTRSSRSNSDGETSERTQEPQSDSKLSNDSSEGKDVKKVESEQSARQRYLTFGEKLRLIVPLLKFLIPMILVYVGEYMINQGLFELIIYDCSSGANLSVASQYRWYQVLYQVGVFVSRSSLNVVPLSFPMLIFLAVLQLTNLVVFLMNAIHLFIPHIWIVFALTLIEGIFGGASYVNTFNQIHRSETG